MSYRFEKEVSAFLSSYGVPKSEPLIVAFSGGADSLSLLIALSRLGYSNVKAVYVNHNLRDEAELSKEIELNKKNAERLNIPLIIAEIKKGEIENGARVNNSGLEGEARKLRLERLESEALRSSARFILTAHNKDDRDEWEIISFFRGAIEPSTIPEKRDMYLRPLLFATHTETERYCKEHGFEYAIDSTNNENEHLRNQVRNLLLPRIREIFPSFENAFETRRALLSHSSEEAIPITKSEYFCIPCVEIPTSLFENHSSAKKTDAVLNAFSYFDKATNGGRISLRTVADVLSILEANNSTVHLIFGVYVFKTRYDLKEEQLVFMKKADVDEKIQNRDKNKTYAEEGVKIKINGKTVSALKFLKDKKVPSVLRSLVEV